MVGKIKYWEAIGREWRGLPLAKATKQASEFQPTKLVKIYNSIQHLRNQFYNK